MEESDANNDPYSFDGYDSDVDKEYLPLDLEERNEDSISTSAGDTQEETVEESVGRQAEVNLNERANTKKGVMGPVNRSRKRKRDSNTWACNVRKKKHNNGEEYISSRKKLVSPNKIENSKDCLRKCHYKCSQKISGTERKEMFREYYARKISQKKLGVMHVNKLCTEEDRLTDEDKGHYQNHILEKNAAREERQKDREGKTAVLTFDLQNVLTCPKADISKFFYKSKLSVYNLTAHLSIFKQVYCDLWSGRKSSDLASALYKILQNVIEDHPNLEETILWSDSCVPQNRNSIMSFAVQSFLKLHPNLRKITMTYFTPGHSRVQEVESVHSSTERVL
ncbi:hypothetical protein ILUMI_06713, partial [Ignelater luminosus]